MGITQYATSGTAILLSGSGVYPQYIGIGDTSGTETGVTGLYGEVFRIPVTEIDTSTTNKVKWIADKNAVDMSGVDLTEFGLFTGSPGGKPWHYVNFGDSITFDGSNELRIEITWELI